MAKEALLILALVAVAFVVILILTIVFSVVSYKRFTWELTESEVHVCSGIFFKKQAHIPFSRIQSIDFNAAILERIIGIVKLKIETAGGSSNRGVMIPALKLAQAEALRAEVFARKQHSVAREEAQMQMKMQALRSKTTTETGAVGIAGVGVAAATAAAATAFAADAQRRFDPMTGEPLPVASGIAPDGAIPRFDPMTGELLPITSGVAPDGAIPRFDPQTGQPLSAVAMAASASIAATRQNATGTFMGKLGSDIGNIRGVFSGNYNEEAPIEYEHGLSAKELIFSAVSGDHNFVLFAILAGLASQVGQIASFFGLADPVEWAVKYAINNTIVPVIVGAIVILFVIMFVLGILNTAISYGGFKARRRGGRIEVERGLLARQYKGVAISRIQSVEIRQGFIRRLMGYGELKLLTIDAMSTEQKQNGQAVQSSGLVIHPFVKVKRIDAMLSQILPEFNGRPQVSEYRKLPKAAFRRVFNRHTILSTIPFALLAIAATIVLPMEFIPIPAQIKNWILIVIWVLVVLHVVVRTVGSVFWYKNAAYAYTRSMLAIRQGFYGRTTVVIPRNKIQWAYTRQNPIQKLSHVASIVAVTAAGYSGTSTKLRDLDGSEAIAYLEWVRPRGKTALGS